MRQRVFHLLTLRFPNFSVKDFHRSSKLERAQWLYQLVYQVRFEFVSHFLFGPFSNYIKNPEEFLEGLLYGQGGVCLERVMALRFLLELFEVGDCSYLMGGSLPGTNQPMNIENVKASLLNKELPLSPYAHHAALVVKIYDQEWLLDPNGGRLGPIFLNPLVTSQILTEDVENKLGVMASFGQMFYTRSPEEIFQLTVAYRRGSAEQMLDLICRVGLLVGSNYDVFMVSKEEEIARLYPPRVQTMCWQINGSLLDGLTKHGLAITQSPGEDRFIQKIDSAYALLNELSPKPLKMVLRVATNPWSQFTEVAKAIPPTLMMR